MGNVLSVRFSPMATETRPIVTGDGDGSHTALFLSEMDAESAAWSQESKCVVIKRFFGWLPDSTAEKLKQDQLAALYIPRAAVHDIGTAVSRGPAILVVQRVYRRFRLLRKWHFVALQVLEIARNQLDERAALESEEELLANFRQLLSSGFSAQKVSITGALKNIQLELVLKADEEECYLTWTPSKKREARIHLHDIQEVVPVLKEGNKHAPRLANKVSHRRGLIIICKSHHRGRVVLQMNSKRERKILLLGFRRLLEDLNSIVPNFDDAGAIRKRIPRRKSTMNFFDPDQRKAIEDNDISGVDTQGDVTPVEDVNDSQSDATQDRQPLSPTKVSRRDSKSIMRLYETRFDESPVEGAATAQAPKPSLIRRSSMVM